jgi:hypothetical protein
MIFRRRWNPAQQDNFNRPADLTPNRPTMSGASPCSYGQYSTAGHGSLVRASRWAGGLWVLWSADDKDRGVLQTTTPGEGNLLVLGKSVGRLTRPHGVGRDWVSKTGWNPGHPRRFSLMVGPRPWIIGNNLSGVSVTDVIPRPRKSAAKPYSKNLVGGQVAALADFRRNGGFCEIDAKCKYSGCE